MLRKLTKLITNNFRPESAERGIAVILWMVVVNVEDPDRSAVFTVPVGDYQYGLSDRDGKDV